MSISLPLPPSVQGRLSELGGRVRWLRAWRGAGRLALTLAPLAAAALVTDLFLNLPPLVRLGLLSGWVLTAAWGLARWVLAPLTRRPDDADLAAAIEQQYPELGERLLSSVELARDDRPASPALVRMLLDETEARTAPLDFAAAAPGRGTRWTLALAAAAVTALLAPAYFYPLAYTRLAGRFLFPLASPAADPDFTFAVEPGDVSAAKGRQLPIRVTPRPRDELVMPAGQVTLTARDDQGERRFVLLQDNAFTAQYTPRGDTEYWFTAGNATSQRFTITAVDPVELLPDSPTITITPPEYARATVDGETAHGLTDLSALRGSEIRFAFAFNRPAVTAALRFTPTAGKLPGAAVPLTPAPDRRTMTATLPVNEEGEYRLLLEAEAGVRTPAGDEPFGGRVTVKPDRPPVVLAMKGVLDGRKIRAHDRLTLDGRFADDVAVAGAAIEYRVNDATQAQTEALKVDGAGRREAGLRQSFALAGKVKPGDVLHYRLRYQDNRPAHLGGPNVQYLPEGRWFSLEAVDQGQSPREEEIAARRNAIDKKLEAVGEELRQEARAADKVRAESRTEEELPAAQRERLTKVQEQNRRVQKMLEEVAREAEKETDLQPLADLARELATQEMADAGKQFDRAAAPKAEPARREGAFRAAEKELSAALDKLDRVKQENDRLAKDRTDQAKVEALADRQKALAEQAAEKEDAAALKREQEKVEEELARLARDSDLLKKAMDEARAEQARQEAEKAADLARQQRELAAAIEETDRARNRQRLADLAGKQEELAAKAARLAKDTEKALNADRAGAMKPGDAAKAADSLKGGDPEKALAEQDRTARELDRLARDLQRLADGARDPREAARQLAILEEMLGKKAKAEKELAPEKGAALAKEQAALREAVQGLETPPARKDIAAQKRRAGEAMAEAEAALAAGKKGEAEAKLDDAKNALRKLAGMLPTAGERQAQARRDLEPLIREQEDLARRTDLAKHEGRPTEALASKQDNLARRLGKVDAPGQEGRRDRAREEMARAAADLEGKNPEDAKVAQDRAARLLDRIKDALDGRKPADEKAADLARRQRELAERAEKAAADPTTPKARLDDLRGKQNELTWEAEALAAPDTPAAKKEAARAARDAAKQANARGAASPEARKAMEESAKKLEDLARAMAGDETDAEKADRLAKQQEKAAQDARDRPGTAADRDRARDLAKELAGTRGGDAKAEKQKARDALDRAAKAAPEQRAKADDEAAEALKGLAKKLAGGDRAPAKPDRADAKGSPLASKELADAAKGLADEQRQLRDAVRRETAKREAPARDEAGPAAKEQADIAREAAKLAKDVAGEQGEKSAPGQQADAAGKAAGKAADELARGAMEKAGAAGKDAEAALKDLAKSLQGTPRGGGKGDTLQQARGLAARQEKLNRQMGSLGKDADATRGRQAARQGELEDKAGDLAERLGELGKQAGDAAAAARAAREAMRQAGDLDKQGQPGPAQAARERAARALERAAGQAAKGGGSKGSGESGKALAGAKGQMGEAREQLGKGRPDGAAKSMASAAQMLREAAEALGRSMQPPGTEAKDGQPGPGGKAGGGAPDGRVGVERALGFDPRKWGELPGELKTKITQDLRAKFGDDYARMIKLYFEQLADARKK